MKALVTGGAGFIGSHLVDRLVAEGHSVAVLDDFNDAYSPAIKWSNIEPVRELITLHQVDIRDAAGIERVMRGGDFEIIFHLAARAGVRPSIREPRLYIQTNVEGAFNVLEAARKSGVPRLIFASSSSVYGLTKAVPFSEEMCISETISPYAATKLAGEQLCSNFAHLYAMQCLCVRFFTVYGPRQRPDLAIHRFTKQIYEGVAIDRFGDGSTRRDYTYIDDVVQGLMACLKYERKQFDIFNLGENETTTLNELIRHIEEALGKKAEINALPEQPGDVPLTYADISKARRLLGYEPATKLDEGIPKFVEWFLQSRAQAVGV
jgi:UDP-glucuronate 4-epimerase